MNKRKTLYQRLKPEVKTGFNKSEKEGYEFSVNIIVSLLKSTQYYSDLTIENVKNIIVFSDIEPKSIVDLKYGDFLFKPTLNESP